MLEGDGANTLARRPEDGVGHRRRSRRQAGLTDPTPLVAAAEGKVGFHFRHLTQLHDGVVIKIALFEFSSSHLPG